MRALWVCALAIAASVSQQPDLKRCDYVRLDTCDLTGCRELKIVPGSYILTVDRKVLADAAATKTIPTVVMRCDAKGCSTVEATVSAPGAFVNIGSVSASYQLKIAAEDGIFTEIASTGFLTLVYHGKCQ